MIRKMKLATLALFIVLATSSAYADLYKCKDSAGKISYQSQPCESAATVKTLKRETSATAPTTSNASAEADFQRRRTARLDAEAKEAAERIAAEKEAYDRSLQEQQTADLAAIKAGTLAQRGGGLHGPSYIKPLVGNMPSAAAAAALARTTRR
jgi:hypothetical protein